MAFLFDKMSTFITDTLIEGGVIKSEERNLYVYCFGTIVEMLANIITTILIGILLGRLPATLIFLLVFIPLRSTAGGYHCETSGKCFILSMSVYLSIILTYKLSSIIPTRTCVLFCVIDFALILILSPVASPNKPLSLMERKKNRCISIVFSLFCIVATFIMMNYKIIYAFVVIESITAAVISLAAGFFKYRKSTKTTTQSSKTTIHRNFDAE